MRVEVDDIRCGGFRIVFGQTDGETPRVRMLPGERALPPSMTGAVLQGLSEAPRLFSQGLRALAPVRPYDRVEVSLFSGDEVQGEAMGLGSGCIRLSLGERAHPSEVLRIARHEALHLLLAAALPSAAKWDDPELAFADWIVRGLEALREPHPPRLGRAAPILEKLPRSRVEVLQRDPSELGEPLASEVRVASEQKRLWLCEAALGAHYLECAARLAADAGDGFLPVALDDWLCDYEQYARGLGNAPSGAGKLWRLSEPGFSRDPVVRLAAAAQALQALDGCLFMGDRHDRSDEPVLWKSRGRVRLPLFHQEARARPSPIHALRAAVRGLPQEALDAAARGAEGFEARVLWPRILARLVAQGVTLPQSEPETPQVVQIVDGEGGARAFAAFDGAARMLREIFGDGSVWVPEVRPPRPVSALVAARADLGEHRQTASMLLVHGGAMTAHDLRKVRELGAAQPVRGALFADLLQGAAYEELPDLPAPLDPRYREEAWSEAPLAAATSGGAEAVRNPAAAAALVEAVDAATREGRLTTPASFLLSLVAPGLEERHPPRARAEAD
ncbi:MAG TPA: hypothetical protein VGH20_11885 [Myxococcales bacterium]